MDNIFSAMGHPVRLAIVLHLAANGETRQVDLVNVLNESDVAGRKVHPGEMPQYLRPLFDAELIVRDRPRGPIRLTERDQIRRLLTTASALNIAVTTDASDEAKRQHADLMRQIAKEISGSVESG